MKEIYKYKVSLGDLFSHELPIDHKVVMVDKQDGEPYMWIEAKHVVSRKHGNVSMVRYQVFGTGHEIPVYAKHVDSFQDGGFVWHLYVIHTSLR